MFHLLDKEALVDTLVTDVRRIKKEPGGINQLRYPTGDPSCVSPSAESAEIRMWKSTEPTHQPHPRNVSFSLRMSPFWLDPWSIFHQITMSKTVPYYPVTTLSHCPLRVKLWSTCIHGMS